MFHNRQSPDVETVHFSGTQIKLLELKRSIVEIKKFSQGMNFDLTISDADNSSKVYTDDNSFVPKNTTVIVKRKPVPSGGIGLLARLQGAVAPSAASGRAPPSKQEQEIVIPMKKTAMTTDTKSAAESRDASQADGKTSEKSSAPSNQKASSEETIDEEMALLKSLSQKNTPSYRISGGNKVWTADGKHVDAPTNGNTSFKQGYIAGRKMPNTAPPPEYRCNRCGKKGHYIAHCPTNNDPAYNRAKGSVNTFPADGKTEKSVGVPQLDKSSVTVKDLTGVDTEGKMVVPVKDGYEIIAPSANQFASLVNQGGAKSSLADLDMSAVPPPLKCPVSGKLLRDAVSTPCCQRIVSDEGYRQVLFQTQELCCPLCKREGIAPDELLSHKDTKIKVEDFLHKVLGPPDEKGEANLENTTTSESGSKDTEGSSEEVPPPRPPPPPGPPPSAPGPGMNNLSRMNMSPMDMNMPPMNMQGMVGPSMGMGQGGMGGPPPNFNAQRSEIQAVLNLFDNGPYPKVWDLEPLTLEQFEREQRLQRAWFEEQAARKKMGYRPGERRVREPFIPSRKGTSRDFSSERLHHYKGGRDDSRRHRRGPRGDYGRSESRDRSYDRNGGGIHYEKHPSHRRSRSRGREKEDYDYDYHREKIKGKRRNYRESNDDYFDDSYDNDSRGRSRRSQSRSVSRKRPPSKSKGPHSRSKHSHSPSDNDAYYDDDFNEKRGIKKSHHDDRDSRYAHKIKSKRHEEDNSYNNDDTERSHRKPADKNRDHSNKKKRDGSASEDDATYEARHDKHQRSRKRHKTDTIVTNRESQSHMERPKSPRDDRGRDRDYRRENSPVFDARGNKKSKDRSREDEPIHHHHRSRSSKGEESGFKSRDFKEKRNKKSRRYDDDDGESAQSWKTKHTKSGRIVSMRDND